MERFRGEDRWIGGEEKIDGEVKRREWVERCRGEDRWRSVEKKIGGEMKRRR